MFFIVSALIIVSALLVCICFDEGAFYVFLAAAGVTAAFMTWLVIGPWHTPISVRHLYWADALGLSIVAGVGFATSLSCVGVKLKELPVD